MVWFTGTVHVLGINFPASDLWQLIMCNNSNMSLAAFNLDIHVLLGCFSVHLPLILHTIASKQYYMSKNFNFSGIGMKYGWNSESLSGYVVSDICFKACICYKKLFSITRPFIWAIPQDSRSKIYEGGLAIQSHQISKAHVGNKKIHTSLVKNTQPIWHKRNPGPAQQVDLWKVKFWNGLIFSALAMEIHVLQSCAMPAWWYQISYSGIV